MTMPTKPLQKVREQARMKEAIDRYLAGGGTIKRPGNAPARLNWSPQFDSVNQKKRKPRNPKPPEWR